MTKRQKIKSMLIGCAGGMLVTCMFIIINTILSVGFNTFEIPQYTIGFFSCIGMYVFRDFYIDEIK